MRLYGIRLKDSLSIVADVAVVVGVMAVIWSAVTLHQLQQANRSPDSIVVGQKIRLAGADHTPRTVILALQDGCHYCNRSMPFYQRLQRQIANDTSVQIRLLAVFPTAPERAKAYLAGHGINDVEVRQESLASLGVSGTPTVIIVKRGVVQRVWAGELSSAEEAQVFENLKG